MTVPEMPEGTEPPADMPTGPAATEPLLGAHSDGTPCVRPGQGCETRGCPPPKPDPVAVADEFALEVQDREGERALAATREREATSRTMARFCSLATAAIFLGFFIMLASIVHSISTEHDHEHAHQVTVWCYADPNRNDATSELVGSPSDVLGRCPGDRPSPGQSFDPNNP